MNAKNIKLRWLIGVTITALVLSGCGLGASAEPTTDPNMVFTQVAETVMVSMTQTAEAVPPTPTPEPTSTPEPEPTPTTKPTKDPDEVEPTQQPAQPAAPAATQQFFGDKAVWLSNNPADGATLSPGQRFNMTICFNNAGSTTWTEKYYLVYGDGYNLYPTQSRWYIDAGKKIEPGKKWCFTLLSIAPSSTGSYVSRWYMKNAEQIYMGEVYFPFKVTQ